MSNLALFGDSENDLNWRDRDYEAAMDGIDEAFGGDWRNKNSAMSSLNDDDDSDYLDLGEPDPTSLSDGTGPNSLWIGGRSIYAGDISFSGE